MKGSSEIVLKTHLDRLDSDKRQRLMSFLSKDEKERVDKLPSSDVEFSLDFELPADRLKPIHYSWLLDPLEQLTAKEQSLILNSTQNIFGSTLVNALAIKPAKIQLSSFAKNFFYSYLYKQLCDGHSILPAAYLPFSPMNSLLRLNKGELIELIHKLSLFDLNIELRHIVDTKTLKKIFGFLTEEEKLFLKSIGHEKETFSWPRLGLDRWDRTQEHFKTLLHRRGIYRLAVGVYAHSRDFMWHLSHRLDTGRGTILLKAVDTQLPQRMVEATQAQILQIIKG